MIDFFNKIYSLAFNNVALFESIKLNSFFRYSIRHVANKILPIYLSHNKINKYSSRENLRVTKQKLIVSLTSFPRRINHIWMVIDILLRQTVKVDKIILYLSKEQFPRGVDDLPNKLLYYENYGLEITFVDGYIRSHKKYYYAFRDYPNDIVITVDDDIFYPTTMLETLLYFHHKYPNAIISRYARCIQRDQQGYILSSRSWRHIRYNDFTNDDAFFGTGGGTLFPFPSKSLYKDSINIQLAQKLTPIEDDLWLNTMARLKRTPIIVIKDTKDILPIIISENIKLFSENGGIENKTDAQLKNVIDYYKNQGYYPYVSSQKMAIN